MSYFGSLRDIVEQDWWSAVDDRDDVDGRCAKIARDAPGEE